MPRSFADLKAIRLERRIAMTRAPDQLPSDAHARHGFDPNQPRVPAGHSDGGQWTRVAGYPGGNAFAGLSNQSTSSRPDFKRDGPDPGLATPKIQHVATHIQIEKALTGISTIDDMTRTLTNILARAAETVEYVPGLSPATYGRLVHLAFATAVRLGNLPGVGFDDVETTFSLEPGARYGSKHSIRTDVVLRNEVGDIIAIYDVKTGDEGLSRRRVNELLAKTRAAPGTPVIQLHLTRGPSLKAERIGPNLAVRHSFVPLQLTARRI